MFYSSATASSLPLPSSIGRTVVSVEGEKWKVEVSYSSATSLLPLLLSSIGRTVVSVEGEKWKVEFGESVEGEKWKVEFGESVEGGRWKVEVSYSSATSLLPLLLSSIGRTMLSMNAISSAVKPYFA